MLTEDFLTSEYVDKQRSALEIAEQLGIGAKAVIKSCNRYGLEVRDISASKMTQGCKKKYEQTNLERYGAPHNMSREHPARKKMIEGLVEKYGITNVFQRPDVIQKIDQWYSTVDGAKQSRLPGRFSKMHQVVLEHLRRANVEHVSEYRIDTEEGSRRYFDVAIPSLSLIIEINGDRVHANPSMFSPDEIIKPYGVPFVAKQKWNQDSEKLDLAERHGWAVLYLWCSEIKADLTLSYLDYILSLDDEKRTFACNQSTGYLRWSD